MPALGDTYSPAPLYQAGVLIGNVGYPALSNELLGAPQTGHAQPSGKSSNAVPAGISPSGSPCAGS